MFCALAACQLWADGCLGGQRVCRGLIEGFATVGLTVLEGGVDLGEGFVLADEVRTAGVEIRISCAATRPLPSRVFSRVWEMMARKDSRTTWSGTISLFACREYVDNTVDGFGGTGRYSACSRQ